MTGLTVVELAGIGPGPYAAMLLGDLGADVICVDRPDADTGGTWRRDVLRRNRRSIIVDLRESAGVDVVLGLVANADVLIEGFRPGVAERLGLGPEQCLEVNARLIYGRMTGWGQTGPLAPRAGHDIGYLALTGALGAVGRAGERPVVPVNFVGDFGGGSTFLVMGILAALWEANRSGIGQVVDAAIVDGAASLTGLLHGLMANAEWTDLRGSNFLDGGVPWYDTYATADGKYVAVGGLEQKFYEELLARLGLEVDQLGDRSDPAVWPSIRAALTETFARKTRDEWATIFADSDACVAPVLSLLEAGDHPHLQARTTFVEVDGLRQPAPAPRFSRTPPNLPQPPAQPGSDSRDVLLGLDPNMVDRLIDSGVVREAAPPR